MRQAAEYLKQNRPDLAVPEFKAVLALDPRNVNAHGNLGAVLYFQGDYAGAIQSSVRLSSFNPPWQKLRLS